MKKRAPELADELKCTGCMACIASCRVGALSSFWADDGHKYVRLDAEKCISCLRCETVCKNALSFTGNNNLSMSSPYAAWACDEELRSASTSGGVAAALCKWFAANGAGAAGVSFDGRRASYVMITNPSEVSLIQGSKYVWSDTEGIYRMIEERLEQGKVLFAGTGCQAAGVAAYFADHKNRKNLYLADLICGGVPSDHLMEVFFKTNPELVAVKSFRNKRKYELKGELNGKEVTFPASALPISGFCAEQTIRNSCFNCPFSYAHRPVDITFGDLWGIDSFGEETERGISLVLVHDGRGREMIKSAGIHTVELSWQNILRMNGRLVFGETPRTFLRNRLARNFSHMSLTRFSETYSMISGPGNPEGFIARLYLHFLRKLYARKFRMRIKSIFG